ncbi:MAG: hypothetical protein LBE85_07835 [Candidatus Accumulibacter sp.]|jgi:hypothetical protein|nr:hypothetical protein [Accumulibacter sp.]
MNDIPPSYLRTCSCNQGHADEIRIGGKSQGPGKCGFAPKACRMRSSSSAVASGIDNRLRNSRVASGVVAVVSRQGGTAGTEETEPENGREEKDKSRTSAWRRVRLTDDMCVCSKKHTNISDFSRYETDSRCFSHSAYAFATD